MRQKRIFMILSIIVATLVLSIAYAAMTSQTLKITGEASATTSDANFDVKFESYTISGDGTTTATIDAKDNKNATISVSGLTTEGQEAIADFVVFNDSVEGVEAALYSQLENSNPDWYKVRIESEQGWYENDGGCMCTIGSGERTNIKVYIKLLKTPVTNSDVLAAKTNINITLTAEAE